MNAIYDNEGLGYNSDIPLPLRQNIREPPAPGQLVAFTVKGREPCDPGSGETRPAGYIY